jgi:ubiquinone/menaquinone biosynthesis C-methylase UbiE
MAAGKTIPVKSTRSASNRQATFDFTPPRPRPFLADLPRRIDSYEEGVARFFQWRTGHDYYAAVDQLVEFVINTRRRKVVDLLADTATFSLRLAGSKSFEGRVYAFDNNITLLERARQRARHLKLDTVVEFLEFTEPRWPLPDCFADIAVSIFDLHRRDAGQFLSETIRILVPEGYLLLAEMIEPKSQRNRMSLLWKRAVIRYLQKDPDESQGVYYDREELVGLIFAAGFRQVVIQELRAPATSHSGVLSLVAATK